ncbi:cyclic nucleotide-binding domain protein (macronuclear) [Tetrahymena thermophila SB210]|uniref:Cyclic nucleotide-binding domain protein n=1 Tax=Tetrahymena thermophila (strain SB210) TaxID=312017 RepID=Q24C55_TETTS|nr:cyclic nucleotide-binding domain protein [Tetrahymena thermophila SB210]EAS05383.2 cyclic nucleotide-binding domain protein [Tetrahymena thermophila SB210]|eukprot:XP_001025628.2 cyclic nucleotide-binding domain protein [Tetrahymena thermophila SB210]
MSNFYKQLTNIMRNRSYNKTTRLLINDLSDELVNERTQFQKNIHKQKYIWQYYCNIPLIDIQSFKGLTIKSIQALINFIYFFVFSLIIIFQVQSSLIQVTNNFIKCFWIVEVITNLNSKIYLKSSTITDRFSIFQYYLKTKLLCDIIPFTISFLYYQDSSLFGYLQVIQYIKVHNFIIDIRIIYFQLYMRVKQFYFVQLVSLTLKLFLIAHVIACFWYLLGLVEIRYLGLDKTWFSDSIGEDLTWWKLYLASMYWTLTLMITGSNISLTVLQTFYTTFIMLFTCIVFGYILSVIGLILAEIEKKQENQNKDIRTINEYMNQKNISNNLKASVNQNLLHYHQKNFQQQQIENNEVLCKISSELKDQLLKEYNMRILERIPILYKNFSQQTLNEISLCLKEEYFFPNSIIQFENDIQNQSLMIIIEGQVEVNSYPSFPNKQQAGVTLLNSGDVFGHLSFLTGLASQIKTKSTDFTKIMRLDRSDLLNILKKNDAEYQKFCEIKDKILLYSRYSEGGLKCQLCESSTHLIYNCSHINLNKNGMLTKLRIFEQENQNRKQFKRKSQYNQTPLALIKYQKGIIKNLQFQLECESFFSHQSQSENSSSESSQNEQQDEIVSFKQYNQKRQSEVFKMESDLNTVQLFDRINNNFRYSAQLTKLDSRENEEILMLDSKKIQKVDSQNENQGSNLNNQINISQSSNGACISNLNVQINSPEVEQKNAIQTNKINSYLSNFLPRRQSIAKKIPECNESKTNYSNQISLEKRRQGINDFFLKIFEKGQLYQQTIAMNAIKNNDTLQQSLEYNEWLFDSLRDFEFYFNYNNSKYILNKLSKVKIKKIKQQKKVKADLKEKIK